MTTISTHKHDLTTDAGRKAIAKDGRAAGYRVQHSAHGSGRRSVQVFDRTGLLVRDFDVRADDPETAWSDLGL